MDTAPHIWIHPLHQSHNPLLHTKFSQRPPDDLPETRSKAFSTPLFYSIIPQLYACFTKCQSWKGAKLSQNYYYYFFFISPNKFTSFNALARLVQPVKIHISLCICSLIRVFADHMCLLQPPGYPKRDKQEPLPYWMDVQTDLSLCWSHASYCRFSHALACVICWFCLQCAKYWKRDWNFLIYLLWEWFT